MSSINDKQPAKRGPSIILVALLISVLVHHVIVTLLAAWISFDIEKEERIDIVLADAPEPEEPKEIPAPKVPEKELQKPKIKAKPRAKKPQPTVQPQQPKPSSIAQAAPPSEEPSATPEPAPLPKQNLKLNLDWKGFERVFNNEIATQRESHRQTVMAKRTKKGYFGGMTDQVRVAMNRNSGWVKPGNQEPLGKRAYLFKRYLEIVHDKIHVSFAHGFLGSLGAFSPDDPINNPDLMAMLEFEILSDGRVGEVRLIRTSGNTVFDAAAVESAYRAGPHPVPPREVRSWNNKVYFRWGFYRNQRMCGVFNAEPYIIKSPGKASEDLDADHLIVGG